MTRWLNQLQPWGILILRLVLGLAMTVHGSSRAMPAGPLHLHSASAALDRSAHPAGALGLPGWLDSASIIVELAGGLLLIVGLLTRFAAFLVTLDLLLFFLLPGLRHGYNPLQYPLALASIAFLLLLTGPGRAALDRKIGFS